MGVGAKTKAEGGASVKGSKKSVDEHRTLQEISSSADSKSMMTYTTTCTTEKDKNGNLIKGNAGKGTGLWQWIVSTEDYNVAAFTPHTVCRRGANAFIAPLCPYYACLDEECTKCNGEVEDSTKATEGPEDGEAKVGAEVKQVKVPTKEELAAAKAEKK